MFHQAKHKYRKSQDDQGEDGHLENQSHSLKATEGEHEPRKVAGENQGAADAAAKAEPASSPEDPTSWKFSVPPAQGERTDSEGAQPNDAA